ncbi:MAG: hypothetical protein KAW42_06055 [Candidatus Atribacteria bacterium]|nr:hypothetical protein [Candidatus Atribacteria bacterium]
MLKSKDKIKVSIIIIGIFLCLLSAGCLFSSTDETKIEQIGKNIESAIEEKDVDLFMENVSFNYSDPDGGTYGNHVNNLPEGIISQMELAESFANSVSGLLKITTDISITDLVVAEQYASGKMKTEFSLKVCVLWSSICIPIPGINAEESRNYSVDFIKEDDDWKIISLTEI